MGILNICEYTLASSLSDGLSVGRENKSLQMNIIFYMETETIDNKRRKDDTVEETERYRDRRKIGQRKKSERQISQKEKNMI